jgi:polar amino acid transport system substrate-binding protein
MDSIPNIVSGATQTPVTETPNLILLPPHQPKHHWFLRIIILMLVAAIVSGLVLALRFSGQKTISQVPFANRELPLITSGKLVIGTDATFPPMEGFDQSGNFSGYDIDLGKQLAEKLGLQPDFKNISFDNLSGALQNKEVDIIISAITITAARKQKYLFSDPYLNAGQVIITRREEITISSTSNLTGKKIAVQKGTTNEQLGTQFTTADLIIGFDDFNEAINALVTGQVDAIFSDLTGAKGIISKNPTLKIASEPFTTEEYGIAVRKGNESLVQKINAALASFQQQGILIQLKQKWLQ